MDLTFCALDKNTAWSQTSTAKRTQQRLIKLLLQVVGGVNEEI
jgi:hypothetical protein